MSIQPIPNEFPSISNLINPFWYPNPIRYSKFINAPIRIAGQGHSFDGFDHNALKAMSILSKDGLILDVSCGINFGVNIFGNYSTPVGNLANAYGIDTAPPTNDRVIQGRAEDMPFKDKTFQLVMSRRALGFYPGQSFNTYWSIFEMVRVLKPDGLVSVGIGKGGLLSGIEKNRQLILSSVYELINDGMIPNDIKLDNNPGGINIRLH